MTHYPSTGPKVKRAVLLTLWLFLFSSMPLHAALRGTLSADASNFSSFFINDKKLRHHRYESHIRQTVKISRYLTTKIEGRVRLDLALADSSWAPYHNYPQNVREAEFTDGEFREFYLNDLENSYRLRIGVQKIDWVESLNPYASDALTPIDLRYGGFGDFGEIIVPVVAINLNHKLGAGTLDWLLVPLPRSDRISPGDNGYGYYPYVESLAAPLSVAIQDQPIPRTLKELEGGVRYLLNTGEIDLTFLLFHGHQRRPALQLNVLSGTQGIFYQTHPQVNTAGFFASMSRDAWVARLMFLYQPSIGSRLTRSGDQSSDRFLRAGAGFDYVFSKDLKFYSEFLATQLRTTLTHLNVTSVSSQMDYMATIKLTNETFKDLMFSVALIHTFPESSYFLSPELVWTISDSAKLNLGAYLIQSQSRQSDLEMLKGASQVYARFSYFFDMY